MSSWSPGDAVWIEVGERTVPGEVDRVVQVSSGRERVRVNFVDRGGYAMQTHRDMDAVKPRTTEQGELL